MKMNWSNNDTEKITAFMIRNDGKAIPCVQHIYANKSELDETLYAAEWLYKNTRGSDVKNSVLRLIKSYGMSFCKVNFIQAIFDDIERKPYIFLTKDFINSVLDDLKKSETGDIFTLSFDVETALNNEFMRARYGGLYNTDKKFKDMYFRISSAGFDWGEIIYNFVKNYSSIIKTVTIVRDEESTGMKDYYYRNSTGDEYKNYPLSEFLNDTKIEII